MPLEFKTMADEKIIFSMTGVSKIYPPSKQVLKDIYLSFFYGAKIGVLGLNGSGKSSLLYILSGLKRVTSGEIFLKDSAYSNKTESELSRIRRLRFGYVFQQPFLLNYLTARENVLI